MNAGEWNTTTDDKNKQIHKTYLSTNERENIKTEKVINDIYDVIKAKCYDDSRYMGTIILSLISKYTANCLASHDICDKCSKESLEEGINIVVEFRAALKEMHEKVLGTHLLHMATSSYDVLQTPLEVKVEIPNH